MKRQRGTWERLVVASSKSYVCGHCGGNIVSEKAYYATVPGIYLGYIYICHNCNRPTYFDEQGTQTPGALLGGNIEHLPEDIAALYKEIRDATTTNSFTAAVLAGRKLLMHIAVQQGAKPGEKFVEYVDYLANKGYTPPNSKVWVDEIRKIGNEANHEIVIMNEVKAKSIIKFLEMLLKFNYEFPAEAEASNQ